MIYYPQKLVPETKIHGGKTYQCRRLFELAPVDYMRYADLFMGAGSMTYNAPAGLSIQIANDANPLRVLSKQCIRNHHLDLLEALNDYPYSPESFAKACDSKATNCCGQSAAWIVKTRMSRGGLGKDFAWSDRERGGQPGDVNAWEKMLERLPILSARLQSISLFNVTALNQLAILPDDPSWFVYLDPPYAAETRTTFGEYGEYEMTYSDHVALRNKVATFKHTRFMISHYRYDVYDALGWRTVEIDLPNHASQSATKDRRTEIVYMNYPERKEPRWMSDAHLAKARR